MKKGKRLASLLLMVLLAIGTFAVSAYADEGPAHNGTDHRVYTNDSGKSKVVFYCQFHSVEDSCPFEGSVELALKDVQESTTDEDGTIIVQYKGSAYETDIIKTNKNNFGDSIEADGDVVYKAKDGSTSLDSAPKDVGQYYSELGMGFKAENYDEEHLLSSATARLYYTIAPKEVGIIWSSTENLIYNSKYIAPTLDVDKSDLVTGETAESAQFNVEVYKCETKEDISDANKVAEGSKMGAGKYVAKAVPVSGSNYDASEATKYQPFEVQPCPVDLTLSIDSPIDYDGEGHRPEAELNSIYPGDVCVPLMNIKGTSRGEAPVSLDVTDVAAENGSYTTIAEAVNASSGSYTATVPVEGGLGGLDAPNYVLTEAKSCKFKIDPLPVAVDWYRPANDEYGNYIDSTGAVVDKAEAAELVKVESGIPKLIFNGKEQAPVAKIKAEMLKGEDTCNVQVSAPTGAVKTGTYSVVKINLDNTNYTADDKGTNYEIVARPVVLKWEDIGPFTYDSKKHEPKVAVDNIQRDVDDEPFECTAEFKVAERNTESEDGEEGQTYKTDLPTNVERVAYDASNYTATVNKLSDRNYSIYTVNGDKFEGETITAGDNSATGTEVSTIRQHYFIDQLQTSLIWSYDSTTYNAGNQAPTAKIKDLKQKEEDGTDDDCTVKVEVVERGGEDQESSDSPLEEYCDAGTYTVKGTLEGKQHKNYKLSDEINDFDDYGSYEITKAPLTITANSTSIFYGEDPKENGLSYSGLKNGEVNHDEVNGVPAKGVFGKYVDSEWTEATPEEALKLSNTYSKYGKPGSYNINVGFADGYEAKNYKVTFKPGTLTVNDRVSALVVKGTRKGSGIKLTWNVVQDAKGNPAASYDVYMSRCNHGGKKITPKKIKTVRGNTLKVKKLKGKKFKKNTCYKYYVVAKDASGQVIDKSKQGHYIMNNVLKDKFTNAKSMKLNSSSVTLSKGATFNVKATYKKAKKGKKYKLNREDHARLTRFKSENNAVATVDTNGVITAVGSGWCRVYVQGVSGMWKTIEVYVN